MTTIQSCEGKISNDNRLRPLVIKESGFDLIPIESVFNLRSAILPVFEVLPDGMLQGCGTSFVADPWRHLLTALHVVENTLQRRYVALLSYGVAYGIVRVPDNAFARISEVNYAYVDGGDPIAQIQGKVDARPLDLAVIELQAEGDLCQMINLPIRFDPAGCVQIGDRVTAIGYPFVSAVRDDLNAAYARISEGGLQGAQGTVTKIYRQGRGLSRPTPVFEVEANWPHGMSGGPVFNASGEVVGLVSQGMDPGPGEVAGTAWAASISEFGGLLPNLSPLNPDWRRCMGGFRPDGYLEIVAPLGSKALPTHLEWRSISWRIGTDDHMTL